MESRIANFHKEEDFDLINIIDNHLDQFFEEDEIIVFHELETSADENHIDIYWMKPNLDYRPFSILMTCGISRYPMNIPKKSNLDEFIEVIMILPLSWKLDDIKKREEVETWPISHLRSIAKIPTCQDTWLGFGHTISWNNTNDNFPGTRFTSSILFPTIGLPKDLKFIESTDRTIKLYTASPLYPEELNYKSENGSNDLLDKFREAGLKESVDLNRVNVCK